MKRILISVLTITVVAIVGFAVTRAFFSDTETSTGNTINAGSIDISVDDQNPWSVLEKGTIEDMKPSYVRWTRHEVRNVGNNPARLWKHIKDVTTDNNGWSESECSDAGGNWVSGNCQGSPNERNNIDKFIEYDMYIGGDVSGESTNNWLGGQHTGGTMLISEDDGITVRDIESAFVFLGELAPDDSIVVWQSYHMKDETGNWAQTDTLSYTIEFYAEQVNGTGPTSTTLLLENKDGSWNPVIGDGKWGVLKFNASGSNFNYNLKAVGLNTGTGYSLIYYPEPQTTWPWPVTVIADGSSDGSGNLTLTGSTDLGMDLNNAKIWLVMSSDLVSNEYSTWPPTDTLYEYNLINYNDTDTP